jgi:hypothetical protein
MSKHQNPRAVGRTGRSDAVVSVATEPISIGLDKSIRIDMSKLPAPLIVYDADVAWIEHLTGRVSLLFGKLSRNDQNRLRTRLEIRYPPEDFLRAFWGNSRDFHGRLGVSCKMWPSDPARDNLNPEAFPSDKDHSEWVNFDAMCHAGTEASIDFFILPAAAVARFAQGKGSADLKLAPVVRVNLSAFELLRLLDQTRTVAETVESYLPEIYRVGGQTGGEQESGKSPEGPGQ